MRTRQKVLSVLALAGVAAAALTMFDAGCGGTSCESVCTERNQCTGVKQVDCSTYCAALEALNEPANCTGHYDDTLNCYSNVKDPCTDTSCTGTLTSLAVCDGTYCVAHANDTNCQALSSSGG